MKNREGAVALIGPNLRYRCAENGDAPVALVDRLSALEGFRRSLITGHSPLFLCISNRYSKLLESPVSYTKHIKALHSNRHKYRSRRACFLPTLARGALANSLAVQGQIWYYRVAFVALVKPLDSIKGAASTNLQPFLLYGWRRSRGANSLK